MEAVSGYVQEMTKKLESEIYIAEDPQKLLKFNNNMKLKLLAEKYAPPHSERGCWIFMIMQES